MSRKRTRREFIIQARKIHGDRYNYSLVEYTNNKSKITIICKTHGEFYQTPDKHLNYKTGCPKCGEIKRINSRVNDTNYFISESEKVHKDKYDYSLTKYVSSSKKVTIVCREHGEFRITPNNHLRGHGCRLCRNKNTSINLKGTIEKFVSRAESIHGKTYDYSEVVYKNAKTPVTIICSKHGEFEQKPDAHLNSKGCPLCSKSGFKFNKPAILYLIEYKGLYKIGITNSTIKKRYGSRKFKKIKVIKEIYYQNGKEAFEEELKLKRLNKQFLYEKFNNLTESFSNELFVKNILE